MASREYLLHVACVEHIRDAFMQGENPWLNFWHTPNQTRSATEAFFNKKLGVLPGVLDLMFSWPATLGDFHNPRPVMMGVIELKVEGGKLTSAQNRFASWADRVGWHVGEARTVQQLHNHLKCWGLKAKYDKVSEPDYETEQEKFDRARDYFAP